MRIQVMAYDVLDRLEVRMSVMKDHEDGTVECFGGYTRTFDYDASEGLAVTMVKVETAVRAYRGALTASKHVR